MNSTLEFLANQFHFDPTQPSPIQLSFSRYGMTNLLRDLNLNRGAEIGTEHGSYSEKLCAANPNLKLYCVDPYIVSPYYEGLKEQEEVNTFYEAAKQRLGKYNCEIMKMTSMEAVQCFDPNSLDFVFIDGNHHFEFVVNDVVHWSRVVRPGGIVYGHDYNSKYHVKQAIHAFMDVGKIAPWFILHRGGKLIDCWMYVRQESDNINYTANI